MSQNEHTIAREQLQPRKVLEHLEQSEERINVIGNDSQLSEAPQPPEQHSQEQSHHQVSKSQSENSLNNVNLRDSLLPDDPTSGANQLPEDPIVNKISDDFFYESNHQQTVHTESPVPEGVVKLDGFYGHDSFKRYNLQVLDRDTVLYSSGISYTIYNHFTKEKKVLFSKDRGGIGSIAVHPNKKYFAVAEMGQWPNVYIYEYPSLKLYRILRKGTERSYSSICFSGDGELLASVGSDPDYLLSVWQWRQQKLLLKSKAFSQEVYRVTFSQFNQKWLTTSGTGHIRFWKISQTFTGLKLQGDIAKFGQFELSDVISYAQFQDGNVLSSSQYGKLLLWQGNLIKSVVMIDADTPCHRGPIQFVKLLNKKIVTAGADGFIRFWDYLAINQGESDEKFNLYVKPEKEIYFANQLGPAYINWIVIEQSYWLVQNALGTLWKYHQESDKREAILSFNAGRFTDFAMSPLNNCLATTGYDGYVRLWDYGNRKQFYNRKFSSRSQSTCIEWLPFSKKNNGRMLAVGFSDGLVRFIGLEEKSFVLIKTFKVHKNTITYVKCNRQGSVLAVADSSGSIFFLAIDSLNLSKISPFCLFETGFKINDMSWDRSGQKLLLACQDGRLHELQVPKEKECDCSETYLKTFHCTSHTVKMMESQKPNREDLELELLLKKTKGAVVDDVIKDQQWEPAPIMNATYYGTDSSKILCSVDGKFLGYYYIIDMSKERPIGAIQAPKLKTSYFHYSEASDVLFVGFRNGSWDLRHKYDPRIYLRKYSFDQNTGVVKKVALNLENTAIISISEDGTMLTHKFDVAAFHKSVKGGIVDAVQISIPSVILGISPSTFSDKVDFGQDLQQDIVDSSIYCLQDEKLKAEEDMKLSEAQKIKNKKLAKVKELQQLFKDIVEANKNETDSLAKLTPQELVVDPEYAAAFQMRIDEEEAETRKELMWDQQYAQLSKRKLQQYYIDNLQFDKFKVKGINTDVIVSSFKMKKLTPFIQKELDKIEKIIQEEQMSHKADGNSRTTSVFEQSKAILELKLKDQKKGKEENQEVKNKIREAEAEFEKELAQAVATKGDYKLKCANDYVVPENQRLNVSRKKKHLFLHYQYLFEEKREFNKRLSNLRNRKRELVQKLQPINSRLKAINAEISVAEQDIQFGIDEQIELIEADIEITEEDIAQHLQQKQREKQANKKAGGMGMGNNQPVEQKKDQQLRLRRQKKVKQIQIKQQKTQMQIKPRPNQKIKRSALEQEIKQIQKIKLTAQKQKIRNELHKQVQDFDNELQSLKSMKYQLQNDLNLVEMKLLTYSQEFIIFRDMETEDNLLMQQLTTFGFQKLNLESTFIQLSQQIGEIQVINDGLKKKLEEQKRILKQFVYPQDDELRERIIKYYKIRERKRISKLKKQAELEEKEKQSDNDDSEEEEEEVQQEEDSQDEFDDDDEKPDITIVENDHKNFERVRKICEYDEKIEEYSKRKSDLEKQRNQVTNKIKNITVSLTQAEKQLKAYQKKKLLKVNQVNVSLPLRLSQIEYHVKINNKLRLNEDFYNAILFTRPAFVRLGERIQQLKKEKLDIEKKQRNLNKKLVKLTQQVDKASFTIQSKRKEYEEKQLLKFGSTFQIEKLKQLQPTTQVMEMRELYRQQQRQASKKIERVKEQLQERKRELLEAKRQNTKIIMEITELGDKQNSLKKKLDSTNKQLFKNYDVSKKDELEKQRQNLKDLIKFLSKEIDDLKMEIGLFKRKGGHIYTMVTSNKKNFA